MRAVIIIVIILLIIAYAPKLIDRYGQYNTERVIGCIGCSAYPVHNEHEDKEAAAELIEKIVRRSCKLTKYLRRTYEPAARLTEPDSRIDDVPAGSDPADPALSITNSASPESMRISSEAIRERVHQLLANFNPKDIREISPLNSEGLTSYTENKTSLVLCLRQKVPDAAGQYPLHDINTMMFVTIHEMTHMMNNTWGHPVDFWELFRFMLISAQECGVYTPVDYGRAPIIYCGLRIDHNPYYAQQRA